MSIWGLDAAPVKGHLPGMVMGRHLGRGAWWSVLDTIGAVAEEAS